MERRSTFLRSLVSTVYAIGFEKDWVSEKSILSGIKKYFFDSGSFAS